MERIPCEMADDYDHTRENKEETNITLMIWRHHTAFALRNNRMKTSIQTFECVEHMALPKLAHVKRLFSVCIFSCKKNEYLHTIYIVIMIKLNESRDCVPDFINPSTHPVYCVFEWNGVWLLAQWQCRHQRKKTSRKWTLKHGNEC